MKKVSIIIPTYNEEKNVFLIAKEVESVLSKLTKLTYEIIFIDDGSKDKTWEHIQQLSSNVCISGIRLSRNFGHQAALQAGLENAKGDAVISIDADLQQPPQLIKELISLWEKGFLVVNTIRVNTNKINPVRKFMSTLFYSLIKTLTSLQIRDGEADFRLLDRQVVNVINNIKEQPKFYRGIVEWLGYKTAYIKYTAKDRINGKSSYTLSKLFELARIGFTSFTIRPLKFILLLGTLISIFSFIFLIIIAYYKLFINYYYFTNTVMISAVILFCTGVMIDTQGIIALYLIDIYNESKGRPIFIVSEKTSQ